MASKKIEELREQRKKIQQQIEEAQAAEAELAAQIEAEEKRAREIVYINAGEAFEKECRKLGLEVALTKTNMRKLANFATENGFADYLNAPSKTKKAKPSTKSSSRRTKKEKPQAEPAPSEPADAQDVDRQEHPTEPPAAQEAPEQEQGSQSIPEATVEQAATPNRRKSRVEMLAELQSKVENQSMDHYARQQANAAGYYAQQ